MRGRWKDLLQDVLPEYERLASFGLSFDAISKLGEVLAVADESEVHAAKATVRNHVTAAMAEAAVPEAIAVRSRVLRVLSIGTEFQWEELVLVLTLRVQLDLALAVMDLFGVDATSFDLTTLDSDLREVALSKQNRRYFMTALATMRRNWGIPIFDRWSD